MDVRALRGSLCYSLPACFGWWSLLPRWCAGSCRLSCCPPTCPQIITWSKAADFAEDAALFKAVKAVSKKYKGKLVFVTVNNEGDAHEPVTNYFGLKDAASPTVRGGLLLLLLLCGHVGRSVSSSHALHLPPAAPAHPPGHLESFPSLPQPNPKPLDSLNPPPPPQILGFYMEKNKKYKLKVEPTEEALMAFAESVVEGTATAEYKSQPIPEEPIEDGVYTVVGKAVDAVVLDPKKDVLLEVGGRAGGGGGSTVDKLDQQAFKSGDRKPGVL